MVELPMPLYHPSNNFKNDKTTKCTYRYTLEPYKQLTCKSTIGALIRLTPSIDLMSSSFDTFWRDFNQCRIIHIKVVVLIEQIVGLMTNYFHS